MITKTYNKKRGFDPQWWFLIAFILAVLIINVFNCSGQYIEISHRNDACENYETAVVTAYYPTNVYSMSLYLYYDYYSWNLVSVARSDVFIDGFLLDSIYSDRWVFSWYSLHPLAYSDTLFTLVFQRIGNFGGGDLEWSVSPGGCEITDFNANPISCYFIDGWLRCLAGCQELTSQKLTSQKLTSRKFIKDGKLFIERDGVIFDVYGREY
jgi:hypothetical protein